MLMGGFGATRSRRCDSDSDSVSKLANQAQECARELESPPPTARWAARVYCERLGPALEFNTRMDLTMPPVDASQCLRRGPAGRRVSI